MASGGTNDFYLQFGSDADVFGPKLAGELADPIAKVNALRTAMEEYDAVAAKLRTGGTPINLNFQGLEDAAGRIEKATTGFTRQFGAQIQDLVSRIAGLAEVLASGARYQSHPVGPPARGGVPPREVISPRVTTPGSERAATVPVAATRPEPQPPRMRPVPPEPARPVAPDLPKELDGWPQGKPAADASRRAWADYERLVREFLSKDPIVAKVAMEYEQEMLDFNTSMMLFNEAMEKRKLEVDKIKRANNAALKAFKTDHAAWATEQQAAGQQAAAVANPAPNLEPAPKGPGPRPVLPPAPSIVGFPTLIANANDATKARYVNRIDDFVEKNPEHEAAATAYQELVETFIKAEPLWAAAQQKFENEKARVAEANARLQAEWETANAQGAHPVQPPIAQASAAAAVTDTDVQVARASQAAAHQSVASTSELAKANAAMAVAVESIVGTLAALDTKIKDALTGKVEATPAAETETGSAEVQVGNTTSNPVPVVVVGGEEQAGGGRPGSHHRGPEPTKTATTATSTAAAKEEVEAAAKVAGSNPEPVPTVAPRTPRVVVEEATPQAAATESASALGAAANSLTRTAEQWAALSASYRGRLERGGVTEESYMAGASLKGARGKSGVARLQREYDAAINHAASGYENMEDFNPYNHDEVVEAERRLNAARAAAATVPASTPASEPMVVANTAAAALGRARRIGGASTPPPRPPRPPAPPAAPEPEEPQGSGQEEVANLREALRNLKSIGTGSRDLRRDDVRQGQFAQLHEETQRGLTALRAELEHLATLDQKDPQVRAQQDEVVARAGGLYKSDPKIDEIFNNARQRTNAFADFMGIDTSRRGNVGYLRGGAGRQGMLASGGMADDYFDPRLRQDARAKPGGANDPKTPARRSTSPVERNAVDEAENAKRLAEYDQLRASGSMKLTSALVAQAKAQNEVNRLTAQGNPDAEAWIDAQMRLAKASQDVVRAEEEQANAGGDKSAWQRFSGKKAGFGDDLRRHVSSALTNTVGYSLVFTGFEKLKEVVHTGIEADAAFVRLQASLDANHVAAGNLSSDLGAISANTATPLEHVIEAASELAGTFKNISDLSFATNVASQLANISQGTLTAKEAAVGLRDVVSAFGNEWVNSGDTARSEIGKTGDQIAHLSQLTGVSIKDITEGTTQIAQEAHDFNLNQRQSATLAAYVTQGTGETGEQAASQLSRMLSTLYNGKTQTQLIKLGVATPEEFSNGKIGEILTNLIGKYHSLNDASKQSIAALMGTGIQARAFAALMNGGAAAVKELNGTMDDTGALARQNQLYLQTVAGAIKQLDEDFQNLGSTLSHLGAFDAIGVLAKSLDFLLREFNRIFGGIAAFMNGNPIASTMMHLTTVILEGAAAWKVFGGAITTALVKRTSLTAASLGVEASNAGAIASAERSAAAGVAGVVVPAAKYERASLGSVARAGGGSLIFGRGGNSFRSAFPTLTGGTAAPAEAGRGLVGFGSRDVRSFLPGAQSASQALAAAEAQVVATAAGVVAAEKVVEEAKLKEAAVNSDVTASETAVADAAKATADALAALTDATAAATEATAAKATVEGAGAGAGSLGSLGALGSRLNASFLAKAGLVVGTGMFLWNQLGDAGSDAKRRNAADRRLLEGSTDSHDMQITMGKGGPAGFRDWYTGNSDNKFVEVGNAIKHTAGSFVNLLTGSDVIDPGTAGASDKSNDMFLNENRKYFNASAQKIPELKTEKQVEAYRKSVIEQIEKDRKKIEKAGDNDLNGQGQIAYSINQLEANINKQASTRLAILKGLRGIDLLNSQQVATMIQSTSQLAGMNRDTLRYQQDAAGQIIDAAGVTRGGRAYRALRTMADPNASYTNRLKAQVTADQMSLDSVVTRLNTVGQKGGVAKGSPEYENDLKSRDTLLTNLQTAKDALTQQPVQLAQSLAGLYTSTGNDSAAVSQMQRAIAGLQVANSKLDHDNPQFVANLQQIQQIKVQIAQTAALPRLNQLALTAASSNDPVVQAKANYQAALVALAAANKVYEDEYNAELKAVADAKKALDDYMRSWDGHARGSQLAIIAKLQAVLSGAQKNVNTTGTDPQKQAAELSKDQQHIAEANSSEQLKEAQYSASIAGIRNGTVLARAQLVGILRQEAAYSSGTLKSDEKLTELRGQEAQARIAIADAVEKDAESKFDVAQTIASIQGRDVAAAQTALGKARKAYEYAVAQRKSEDEINAARITMLTATAAVQDAMLAAQNAALELQVARLNARGKAGDAEAAAKDKVKEAQNSLKNYLAKGGKKSGATYDDLLGAVATAQRSAFDTHLQAQLDTLDFQQQTYKITSSQEIASLQQILKNKQLTLQEQRDITLKIKGLQESIRQQLTQGGLNIPSNISLPTAYEVRRSLGAGFGGAGTTTGGATVTNNNQQIQVNNNVPNAQIAHQIANQVINLINQQTGQQTRATTSSPRIVPTR